MSNHETKVKANHLEIEESCMKDYDELTEKDLRIQLAAAYRLVEELGWSFLIFGHLRPENGFFLSTKYFWKITEKKFCKFDWYLFPVEILSNLTK